MIINTHMLIAKRVYGNLKSKLVFKLQKNNFIYGNIKPDLILPLSSRAHTLTDSLEFILEEANKLIYSQDIDLETFSTNLGVINHFLADFFCSPHYYKGNFPSFANHLMYEIALHNFFKKMDYDTPLTVENLKIQNLFNIDMKETIFLLENEYLEESPKLERDIIFALKATTLISYHIVKNSKFNITLPVGKVMAL
ncbi:Zinc dependent phospholipase C [Anaerobranca californiensis DSM 14826]|uniref:Zinc dependent phospholipase C n=1 Tax=Anaerobranca californiensis DSM 14826 TaxID=1120989 RepID=A0A1M6QG18_9FIRM|nr:zinc dependent phospholipase C family protein [Anaerobranca californiensis]SHK19003.1 Zinc dependent phospholipase C [Anaerobranca californiensis DSM 14826]